MKAFSVLQLYLFAAKSSVQNQVHDGRPYSPAIPTATATRITPAAAAPTKNSVSTRQQEKKIKKKAHDHVLDWTRPSAEKIQQTRQLVLEPMKALTSSVFYSTDLRGKRHQGLAHVPAQTAGRPMLFVSNHQLLGIDSWLVVNEIQEKCDIFLRSLTHPFLYSDNPDGTSFMETHGCLPVSMRNFYRLLQTHQPVLLFPGGVEEAFFTTRASAYSLQGWNDHATDKQDFVRAAAKFNATIVPISCTGAAESALFWQDLPVLSDLAPSLQSLLQTAAGARAPANARYDRKSSNDQIPSP